MHPPSQTFCTFLTVLLHHRLRLLHHTQFRRRVSDCSVALAVSCSSASKSKRVIAEPEEVQAKSLKKVVLPDKSHSTRRILAIELAPQNLGYRNYAGRYFALLSTYCPIDVLTFILCGLCDIIVHYSLLIDVYYTTFFL